MRSSRTSTSSGKTAPSPFLHKQLDVTSGRTPAGHLDRHVIISVEENCPPRNTEQKHRANQRSPVQESITQSLSLSQLAMSGLSDPWKADVSS